MKNRNSPSNKSQQLVSFSLYDAQRISDVVSQIEKSRRGRNASWLPRHSVSGASFRVCTFTGAWQKSAIKTVTLKFDDTTTSTVEATNLFASIASATGSRNCAIAREGTAWFLIAAEC